MDIKKAAEAALKILIFTCLEAITQIGVIRATVKAKRRIGIWIDKDPIEAVDLRLFIRISIKQIVGTKAKTQLIRQLVVKSDIPL